jgi:hypothetical protein
VLTALPLPDPGTEAEQVGHLSSCRFRSGAISTNWGDIRDARRRRRILVQIAAERAPISRMTLLKIEKGEPGVVMGSHATVLFVLGLADHLTDVD